MVSFVYENARIIFGKNVIPFYIMPTSKPVLRVLIHVDVVSLF